MLFDTRLDSKASSGDCINWELVSILEFVVGYDTSTFEEYYKTLVDLHQFYESRGVPDTTPGELGVDERRYLERDPNHLIVWMQDNEIIGHAIWHETTTDELVPDDSREDEDSEKLHGAFGGKRENLIELHEVWLKTEHRGRGHGRQFFSFFEEFARRRGFAGIVFYTGNPAAIALCRGRGYREAPEPLEGLGWYLLTLSLR
ncbi:MAG: GNAT family N-acetyltransferase [Candidatus Thorarchaeota archaeon]|nr:GNAT family N-acetyltransferase [Candidatus Thorarchaeota archaeon]